MGEDTEGWIFKYTDYIDLGCEYIGRGNWDSQIQKHSAETNVKSGP